MPPTATLEHERTDATSAPGAHAPVGRRSVVVGVGLTAVAVASTGVWFAWRLTHLGLNVVGVTFFLAEVAGLIGGVAVASGLAAANRGRDTFVSEPRDSHWYAHAVADLVGRTRADDLHHSVRTTVRSAPRWQWRDSADAAVVAVLLDGPRRLLMIAAVVVGLMFGVAPFARPAWWAIVALVVGMASLSAAHVTLGRARIRVGDRTRWTYGAIGEVVGRNDVDGVAPRRWVGAIAAVVVVSVAVALRGMSDRWTHGLPAMDDDERAVLFVIGAALILGALFTIQTTPRPTQVDAHLVSRHLEERTARQTVLAAAIVLATVGLVAGLTAHEQLAEPAPTTVPPAAEVADG